jgi:hypothetical protein
MVTETWRYEEGQAAILFFFLRSQTPLFKLITYMHFEEPLAADNSSSK